MAELKRRPRNGSDHHGSNTEIYRESSNIEKQDTFRGRTELSKEGLSSPNKAGVFEAHSPSVAISEIIQTEETSSKLISFSNETLFSEETAAPSASEGNGDNRSGNKKEFLIALLDEMDFSSETANELPKEAILETASDEKAISSELLVSTEFLD
ncbi:hypothetical protein AVEN_144396-1 [Araneus ventricosus]|uniref:Uncharacterized protein n=1 Tax=Araneus ventricosus TaxID=182803 RepID=A0A4Y2TBZ7_ARAVE|nr:hypothetical protein AVEN_273965-1 [Araneus ventricosus]GBN97313.1 hypothetical protein AVEN_144396-1 [Araneus ventricosus]